MNFTLATKNKIIVDSYWHVVCHPMFLMIKWTKQTKEDVLPYKTKKIAHYEYNESSKKFCNENHGLTEELKPIESPCFSAGTYLHELQHQTIFVTTYWKVEK